MKKKIVIIVTLIITVVTLYIIIKNITRSTQMQLSSTNNKLQTTINERGLVLVADDLVANSTNTQDMANNTAYLQSLVDSVSEKGGGTVSIPKGTYYFSVGGSTVSGGEFYIIKCKNNVRIEGSGNNETTGTILKPMGVTKYGLDMFFFNDYAESKFTNPNYLINADFYNFVIDSEGAQGENYNSSGKGFMINLLKDCNWENVTVKNTDGTGFGMDCPINCTINSCIAIGCGKKATTQNVGASGFGIRNRL